MSRETAFQLFTGAAAPEIPRTLLDTSSEVTTEAPKEQATGKEDINASRIAILAKKEAAIQKDREAFKKEREEFIAKQKEADEYIRRGRDFDDLAKKDKIAALKQIGWSDTDIINVMAESETKEPTTEELATRAAQSETQKLRDELKAASEKAEKDQNDRLVQSLHSEISTEIKTKAEQLKYCAFEGKAAEEQAYQFIVDTLKESGELLTATEAVEMTNSLYEERAKALAKVMGWQEAAPAVEAPPTGRSRAPISNVPEKKDLVIPPPPPGRRETSSEKRDRLIQAIKTGGLTR